MKFAFSFFRMLAISKEFYDSGRAVTYPDSSYSTLSVDYYCEEHNTDFSNGNGGIITEGSDIVERTFIVGR